MSKQFKVGDKVRTNTSFGRGLGYVGKVVRVDGGFALVEFPGWEGGHGGDGYGNRGDGTKNKYFYCFSNIELVKSAAPANDKSRYIVVVQKDGKFAPAGTPREYTSQEQAEKVASQMSERHGEIFYVLKAVSKAMPPVRPKAEVVKL